MCMAASAMIDKNKGERAHPRIRKAEEKSLYNAWQNGAHNRRLFLRLSFFCFSLPIGTLLPAAHCPLSPLAVRCPRSLSALLLFVCSLCRLACLPLPVGCRSPSCRSPSRRSSSWRSSSWRSLSADRPHRPSLPALSFPSLASCCYPSPTVRRPLSPLAVRRRRLPVR